jgi:hypothetical protein
MIPDASPARIDERTDGSRRPAIDGSAAIAEDAGVFALDEPTD